MTRKINREGMTGYIEDLSLFYRVFAEARILYEAKRKSRGRQQDAGRLNKRRLSRHKKKHTHTHMGYHLYRLPRGIIRQSDVIGLWLADTLNAR